MQPMSAELFEQLVLSKPYFDNQGLILALDGRTAVGFVHAGFGANDDGSGISTVMGVTCMLMVRRDYRRMGIGSQLLAHSEQYLRGRGAQVLYGGSIRPLNPFYLGLYGGSELPGVLASDVEAQHLYRSNGYRDVNHTVILHRDLKSFRPIVDRQQIQIRRRSTLKVTVDPPTTTWWQACTVGAFDRGRFDLLLMGGADRAVATVTAWSMEPLSTSWGVRAMGLIDLEVDPSSRRQGLATFLLGEAFRQLQQQGVALIEVQTMEDNSSARSLYRKLGFEQVDSGAVFRKDDASRSSLRAGPAA